LVTRAIVGLSVTQGGSVISGVNMLTWTAVPAATSYCVELWSITAGRTLTGGHCPPVGSSGSSVITPAFVTPPLISGDMYKIAITAFARDVQVGYLADGNVNFTAR
jgi:hypothetical protein